MNYLYTEYIQGLCQSRLNTADYALFVVAPATVVCLTAPNFKPLIFLALFVWQPMGTDLLSSISRI
jgi:hypothetical protein